MSSSPSQADQFGGDSATALRDELVAVREQLLRAQHKQELAQLKAQMTAEAAERERRLIEEATERNQETMASLQRQLNELRVSPPSAGSDGGSDRAHRIEKLRMESIPRWPKHADSGQEYEGYEWLEDMTIQLRLLGYGDALAADPDDPSVDSHTDGMILRYLVAAINNSTISSHVAQTFERKGRAAYKYLMETYGTNSGTVTQQSLRAALTTFTVDEDDDPRETVIAFDRLANRISPPVSEKEKVETLLWKIPVAYADVKTTIEATTGRMGRPHDYSLIRELYVATLTKRWADLKVQKARRAAHGGRCSQYRENVRGDANAYRTRAVTRQQFLGVTYDEEQESDDDESDDSDECTYAFYCNTGQAGLPRFWAPAPGVHPRGDLHPTARTPVKRLELHKDESSSNGHHNLGVPPGQGAIGKAAEWKTPGTVMGLSDKRLIHAWSTTGPKPVSVKNGHDNILDQPAGDGDAQ